MTTKPNTSVVVSAAASACLTASQARGHARAHEVGIKAKPIKSDERLEAALRQLRQTHNQAKAAKEAGVSPERFRRFLREQKLAERKGRV